MKEKKQIGGGAPGGIRKVPALVSLFRTSDDLLDAGLQFVRARRARRCALNEGNKESAQLGAIADHAWTEYWHKALIATASDVPLAAAMVNARLNRVEREILLVLILGQAALLNEPANTVDEILSLLYFAPRHVLHALRCLGDNARLAKKGLIGFGDETIQLPKRELLVDPSLLELAIHGKSTEHRGWPVKSEEELYASMAKLVGALQQKSDKLDDVRRGYGCSSEVYSWSRRATHLTMGLTRTLQAHPTWASPSSTSKRRKILLWMNRAHWASS